MEGPELGGEQQFCLRWNNFQANITSQFEALRDDEDFVDVTLACEGHRLEAHKVVLSACSPYFKELFKSNPCPHPIIFMRDCELIHITALLEFMYAGEVNISQAQLTSFLRTAEALQIRGLTDSSDKNKTETKNTSKSNPSQLRSLLCGRLRQQTSPAKDTSQSAGSNDIFLKTVKHFSQSRRGARAECETSSTVQSHNGITEKGYYPSCLPGSSNNCELKDDALRLKENILANSQNDENYAYNLSESNASLLNENENLASGKINPFAVGNVNFAGIHADFPHEMIEPKLEVPDYTSEDDTRQDRAFNPDLLFGVENAQMSNPFLALQGDAAASTSQDIKGEIDAVGRAGGPGRVSCAECGRRYSNLSNLRQHVRLIHRSQPVACPLCARSFKTPLYLRRHTLSQHSDTLARNRTSSLLDKYDSIDDRALLTPLTDRIPSVGERSSAVSNRVTSCGSRPVAYGNRPRTVSTATLVGLPQLRKMNRLPVMTIDGTNSDNSVLKCINGKTKVFESVNGDASSDSAEDDIIKMEDEEVITDDL